MARIIPVHHRLNSGPPPHWAGGNDKMYVHLTYVQVPNFPDQIRFIFKVTASFPYKEPSNDLGFEIQRDCTIIFELDQKLNSKWSSQYYFITGKEDHSHLYGDPTFIDNLHFSVKAKYNSTGQDTDRQQINLNIDYGQLQQTSGRWSYVPITIDPDVGNPRPPGLRNDVTGPIKVLVIGAIPDS